MLRWLLILCLTIGLGVPVGAGVRPSVAADAGVGPAQDCCEGAASQGCPTTNACAPACANSQLPTAFAAPPLPEVLRTTHLQITRESQVRGITTAPPFRPPRPHVAT